MKMLLTIPRHVRISLAVIAGAAVFFLLSFIFLGGFLDDSIADNSRLKSESADLSKKLNMSSEDYKYIVDNREKFESILQTDKLVPHTRQNAVRQLQDIARQRGLDSLNYSFAAAASAQSLAAVKSQPASGGYRVSVESITLKVGAPLDTQIYGTLMDLSDSFPGSAVIQSFALSRATAVTPDMLDRVNHGVTSGLVSGDVQFVWRTAQAVEPEAKNK